MGNCDVEEAVTEWQKQLVDWCKHGCGVDARPSQMRLWQRREADQLVSQGILTKAKNHTQDRHGMYILNKSKKK